MISGFACEFAVCVWTLAVSGKKKLRIRKYPDTCGRGLKFQLSALFWDKLTFSVPIKIENFSHFCYYGMKYVCQQNHLKLVRRILTVGRFL